MTKYVNGPTAPQDPVARRSGFYLMFDAVIEATDHGNGSYAQELYLEKNQLVDKAKFVGGVEDEDILALLRSTEGFRRLVHSIGITVSAHDAPLDSVRFAMEHWGKTIRHESGTKAAIEVPADGIEHVMSMADVAWAGAIE